MHIAHRANFYHDGRGPELVAVHLAKNSSHLLAIDFRNPGSSDLQHLLFKGTQSYIFTPEEVENYSNSLIDWGKTDWGAMVSLGRSEWLGSFSPRHLEKCEHIRAMFYDEFLDVICEDISVHAGTYESGL